MFQIFKFKTINKKLVFLFSILIVSGLYAFLSASFGILNRNEVKFYNMIESQVLAYVIGAFFGVIIYFLYSKFLYKMSPLIYLSGIVLSLLTFFPNIGLSHGGATRWVNLFGFSLQPSEVLKLSLIFWLAYFIQKFGDKILDDIKYLFLLLFSILPIIIILFLQKDLGSLLIMIGIFFAIYFVSGFSKVSHIIIMILSGIMLMSFYIYFNPYAKSRIETLINPVANSASFYQTEQAYIAISTGGVYGKGLFSGIQKYQYLPEPAGDSVFATFAEETGFIFSGLLIVLFFATFIYILFVSHSRVDNVFEKYLLFGIAIHFLLQIIMNIGSMIGVIPLSGDTLPLFSQGGTSIIINLIEISLILNMTRIKDEDILV